MIKKYLQEQLRRRRQIQREAEAAEEQRVDDRQAARLQRRALRLAGLVRITTSALPLFASLLVCEIGIVPRPFLATV